MRAVSGDSSKLYLIEILHQTTTGGSPSIRFPRCILSKFYIKPQPPSAPGTRVTSCILSKFYIKPQHVKPANCFLYVVSYRNSTSNHNISAGGSSGSSVVSYRNSTSNHNTNGLQRFCLQVVSYRNSTSNHNSCLCISEETALYLIEILHQTTTRVETFRLMFGLYLIEILHQTTTLVCVLMRKQPLYLIEILHQTTTQTLLVIWHIGCILSKFYIKPQLASLSQFAYGVVSYRNSTSNHNLKDCQFEPLPLYLIEILHQTTTLTERK